MKRFQKVLFTLATVVALGWVGTNTASALCSAPAFTPAGVVVRSEGTTEQVSTITITCPAADITGATATIQLALAPSATRFTPTAGATTATAPILGTTTCSVTASDNRTTFPCPSLGSTTAFAVAPTVTLSNNVMTFVFTPALGVQTFTITNIRVNVGTSGLRTGGLLLVDTFQGGGMGSKRDTNGVLASVNDVIGTGSSLISLATLLPLNITACGPAILTPTGLPLTLLANPDPSGIAANSIPVTVVEGMSNAFASLADITAGGFGIVADPLALQGIRLRIQLTNVPSGMVAYVPHQISAGSSGATTGTITGGTSGTLVTRVDAPNPDGSGGSVTLAAGTLAANLNQFDLVSPVAGTATIVYEITGSFIGAGPGVATADLVSVETLTLFIALTGTGNVGIGPISGSLSVGPVGPPTVAASRPQFRAGTTLTVATTILCASYLLFPWVANTGDGAYDTGFAISNTTADPAVIGSTGQSGSVTLYWWRSDGTANPAPTVLSADLAAGRTATGVLSALVTGPFTGYMIAVCNFTLGHGFGFINSPRPGTGGAFAEGYLALSVTNPRISGIPTPTESAGH